MPDQVPPKNKKRVPIETTDVMFIVGLILLLVGLGLSIGWGWGMAVDGLILVGVSLWLVVPVPPKEGK